MSTLAEVRLEWRGGVPVAHVSGQLDLSNAADVTRELAGGLTNEAYGLVIELTRLEYVDSAGVTVFFELAELLARRQQQLRLVVPEQARIRRVLDVVNVGAAAPMVASLEDAVAAIEALSAPARSDL